MAYHRKTAAAPAWRHRSGSLEARWIRQSLDESTDCGNGRWSCSGGWWRSRHSTPAAAATASTTRRHGSRVCCARSASTPSSATTRPTSGRSVASARTWWRGCAAPRARARCGSCRTSTWCRPASCRRGRATPGRCASRATASTAAASRTTTRPSSRDCSSRVRSLTPGMRPPVDLALLFCADEETGSRYGAEWLVREHPELFGAGDMPSSCPTPATPMARCWRSPRSRSGG